MYPAAPTQKPDSTEKEKTEQEDSRDCSFSTADFSCDVNLGNFGEFAESVELSRQIFDCSTHKEYAVLRKRKEHYAAIKNR